MTIAREMQGNEVIGTFVRRINRTGSSDLCISVYETKNADGLPDAVKTKGKTKKGYEFTALGWNLPSLEAVSVRFYGKWKETRYGLQFAVSAFEMIPPDTKKGIIAFLAGRRFAGIGRKTAEAIVEIFGKVTFDVIRSRPEKLLTVRGVSKKKIEVISANFRETENFNRLAVFLGSYGIPNDRIALIADKFGERSVEVLSANPFAILSIRGCGFTTADRIARGLGVMLASSIRIISAIRYVLKEDMNLKGDLWMNKELAHDEAMRLLNTGFEYPIVDEAMYQEALKEGRDKKTIILRANRCLLLSEAEWAEKETSDKLVELIRNPEDEETKEAYISAMNDYRNSHADLMLSAKQEEAVLLSLANGVSIITGSPGTGKTTIINMIIRLYRKVAGDEAEVTLMAPTGKAARRLSESCGMEASTIHRRLGLFDENITHASEYLPEGLIIVDEISMIDQFVMGKLMEAVPTGAKLILVGDKDQLPSVGAGNVLSELLASGVIPTARLTEVFRQDTESSVILDNAQKINAGRCDLIYDNVFRLIACLSEQDAREKILSVNRRECQEFGMDQVMLLCPLRRKHIVSVEMLNKDLQSLMNEAGKAVSASVGGTEYRINDRIVQTKNTEFVSNGDHGVITDIRVETDDNNEEMVIFHIRFATGYEADYGRSNMINTMLAYSETIHKSQGNEAQSVIVPLLSSQKCPLFQRKLIYTAVTRARRRVTIIGDINAVKTCIMNNESDRRNSLLSVRLKSHFQRK